MAFGQPAVEWGRARREASLRRARRRAWLAAVDAALAEADTILDEIAGGADGVAEVRARVVAAREAADTLGARFDGEPRRRTAPDAAGG